MKHFDCSVLRFRYSEKATKICFDIITGKESQIVQTNVILMNRLHADSCVVTVATQESVHNLSTTQESAQNLSIKMTLVQTTNAWIPKVRLYIAILSSSPLISLLSSSSCSTPNTYIKPGLWGLCFLCFVVCKYQNGVFF